MATKRAGTSIVAMVVLLSVAACGGGTTKVDAALATTSCQSFLSALTTTGGLLSPSGQPENENPTQRLATALTDAKSSGDTSLYKVEKESEPGVLGAYSLTLVTAAQFRGGLAKMNDLAATCAPFGVTFPQSGN